MKSIVQVFRDFEIFSNKNSLCIIGLLLCAMIAIGEKNHRDIVERLQAANVKKEITLKKTRHGDILALIPNDSVCNAILNGVREPHVINMLTSYVKPTDIVVECGAHVGSHTVILGRMVKNNGHVYSYDANSDVFQLANLALKMNDITDSVTLKNVCVHKEAGEHEFMCIKSKKNSAMYTTKTGLSNIFNENISDYSHRFFNVDEYNYEKRKVQAVSLDEDLSEVQQIDWLRMDIEGAEILAIQGAKRLIENSPNLKIVTEWNPSMLNDYGNLEELVDYLFSQGFSAYTINTDGSFGEKLSKEQLLAPQHSDLIFVRDETKAQMTVNLGFIPVQDLVEQTFDILK